MRREDGPNEGESVARTRGIRWDEKGTEVF